MPVPTIGALGFIRGTDCLCIFEPINARFASSCSKNGIKAAATLKIWFGATSMNSISLESTTGKSPLILARNILSINRPFLSILESDCAIITRSSSSADRYSTDSVA